MIKKILFGVLLVNILLAANAYATTPEVVFLANSIDSVGISPLVEYLNDQGVKVTLTDASKFDQYKTAKMIFIFGGHKAPEGVGDIVGQLLNKTEKKNIETKGDICSRYDHWNKKQYIYIIAGPTRKETKELAINSKEGILKLIRTIFPEVEILSMNSFVDSVGYLHVVGEVQNNGKNNLAFVEVTATFYDENDKVVGTSFSYTSREILPPSEKSPFEIIQLSNVDKIKKYKVQVSSYYPTTETPFQGLEILSHSSYVDSVGYLHVVGEVKNKASTTAHFVEVIATFYDTKGEVVATSFAYTNPENINPGSTAPFEIILLDNVGKVDKYKLDVEVG